MPVLRVSIDEKLNKIMNEIVESGVFRSKAHLLRFCLLVYLHDIGVVEDKVKKK